MSSNIVITHSPSFLSQASYSNDKETDKHNSAASSNDGAINENATGNTNHYSLPVDRSHSEAKEKNEYGNPGSGTKSFMDPLLDLAGKVSGWIPDLPNVLQGASASPVQKRSVVYNTEARNDQQILLNAVRQQLSATKIDIHFLNSYIDIHGSSPLKPFATRGGEYLTLLRKWYTTGNNPGYTSEDYPLLSAFDKSVFFKRNNLIRYNDQLKLTLRTFAFKKSSGEEMRFSVKISGKSPQGRNKTSYARPYNILSDFHHNIDPRNYGNYIPRRAYLVKTNINDFFNYDSGEIKKNIDVNEKGQVKVSSILNYYGITTPDKFSQDIAIKLIKELRGESLHVVTLPPATTVATTTTVVPLVQNLTSFIVTRKSYGNLNGADYPEIKKRLNDTFQFTIEDIKLEGLRSFKNPNKTSEWESDYLRELKLTDGISAKITVTDSDGEENVYTRQHHVQTKEGQSLSEYFYNISDLLANYFTKAIRDYDGENEGAIEIESILVETNVPYFQRDISSLTSYEIYILDIRDSGDGERLLKFSSDNFNKKIQEYVAGVKNQLASGNYKLTDSPVLMQSVKRSVDYHRKLPGSLSGYDKGIAVKNYDESLFYNAIVKEVLNAFYKAEAYSLVQQQKLLMIAQPTQEEFLGKKLCQYFAIDEDRWAWLMYTRAEIQYNLGASNAGVIAGSFQGSDGEQHQSISRVNVSILELFYNQALRSEIGGADNKNDAIDIYAVRLSDKMQLNREQKKSLRDNMKDFFDAKNFFVIHATTQLKMGEALLDPRKYFTEENNQYISLATKKFRTIEAEKLIKNADDVYSRLETIPNGSDSSYENLLTPSELVLLEKSCRQFRHHLEMARNTDTFLALNSSRAQILSQIKEIAMTVVRNSPTFIGQAIVLADDAVEGADAETITMDSLFMAGAMLGKIRHPLASTLATITHTGTNGWAIEKALYTYQQAMKENRWDDANQALIMLMMSAHSIKESAPELGRNLKEHVREVKGYLTRSPVENPALTHELQTLEETGDNHEVDGSEHQVSAGNPAEGILTNDTPVMSKAAERHIRWVLENNNELKLRPAKAIVGETLWNRDLLTSAGRATAMGNGLETIFVLNGEPTQAVGGAMGPVLRSIHEIPLQQHQWELMENESPTSSIAVRSNEAQQIFPDTFNGLRSVDTESRAENSVGFMKNHYSQFDNFDANRIKPDGQEHSERVEIGVLEHKYVLHHEGSFEVLDFIESHDGTTTFFQDNGDKISIPTVVDPLVNYKPTIDAKIVGSNYAMLAVEIENSVKGLSNKRTVSGFIADRIGGGQTVVLEIDKGVHYHGFVSEEMKINLVNPDENRPQSSLTLQMNRVDALADPKRASPDFYKKNQSYRSSHIAEHDFLLNMYYGAKHANEVYAGNPDQVVRDKALLTVDKVKFPAEIFETDNPYFVTNTTPEEAALFSPANQHFISDKLAESSMIWGDIKEPSDVNFVNDALKKIKIRNVDGVFEVLPVQIHPLDTDAGRLTMHESLNFFLGESNLVITEVLSKNGDKTTMVGVTGNMAQEDINLMANDIDAFVAPKSKIISTDKNTIILHDANNFIGEVENRYPNPNELQQIKVFSNYALNGVSNQHIYKSQRNGYPFVSVTHLHDAIKSQVENSKRSSISASSQFPTIKAITQRDVLNGLSEPIAEGEKKGARTYGENYYLELSPGGFFKAQWHEEAKGFRLLPENSENWIKGSLPLVRWHNDEFFFSNQSETFLSKFNVAADSEQAINRYSVEIDDESSLTRKGNTPGLYQDSVGNEYLEIAAKKYVPTHLQDDGQRVIYSETNRYDFRTVMLFHGEWLVVDKYFGIGGSVPKTKDLLEQLKKMPGLEFSSDMERTRYLNEEKKREKSVTKLMDFWKKFVNTPGQITEAQRSHHSNKVREILGNNALPEETRTQRMLTESYWREMAGDGNTPVDWSNYYGSTNDRSLQDIYTHEGAVILERLDNAAVQNNDAPGLKIYRSMPEAESVSLADWYKNKKNILEDAIRNGVSPEGIARLIREGNVIPVEHHLGDRNQALSYNGDVFEFTLKPGAEKVLFSPEVIAFYQGEKGKKGEFNNPAKLADFLVHYQNGIDASKKFTSASKNEGARGGFIGVKPESQGDFSFSLGRNQASQLLFQLFVDEIKHIGSANKKVFTAASAS